MRSRHLSAFFSMLTLVMGTLPLSAEPFTGIVAFGDSLSDAGNVFVATGGTIPAPPYVGGHFSNGPTWVEDLSVNLGLGTLRPSLAGGTDFAFGSAVTGNSVPGVTSLVPTITQQVGLFLSTTGGVAASSSLYTVWIGSDDVYQAVSDVVANPLSLPAIQSDVGAAAQTETAAINALAKAGATNFVVPLLPDLGITPLGASAAVLATSLSALYNADLVSDLTALAATDHISVGFIDTFSLVDAAVNNPAAFGLTNVTDACYTGPFTGGPPAPCSNPASYLFWDIQHPTETGHELIATVAENVAVPEPPTLPIFMAATFLILICRRCTGRTHQNQTPV
jgi:phospholipase/lecithinase/hemolysin